MALGVASLRRPWAFAFVVAMATAACESRDTSRVVGAFVEGARSGVVSAPAHPDSDSDAAMAAIAKSRDLSVSNWIVATPSDEEGTACYWTTLRDIVGVETDVRFFLERHGGVWKVARVSTVKECRCPRGNRPCAMGE